MSEAHFDKFLAEARQKTVSPERKARRDIFEKERSLKIFQGADSEDYIPHKGSRSKYSPDECQRAGKR